MPLLCLSGITYPKRRQMPNAIAVMNRSPTHAWPPATNQSQRRSSQRTNEGGRVAGVAHARSRRTRMASTHPACSARRLVLARCSCFCASVVARAMHHSSDRSFHQRRRHGARSPRPPPCARPPPKLVCLRCPYGYATCVADEKYVDDHVMHPRPPRTHQYPVFVGWTAAPRRGLSCTNTIS
jgi:hypothetical protein